MDQHRFQRSSKLLWAMVLLAVLYMSLINYIYTWSHSDRLVGSLGIVIGLYICSQPAANAMDLLFFKRDILQEMSKAWLGIGWLVLNLFVLVIGWVVIVVGATRLTGHLS